MVDVAQGEGKAVTAIAMDRLELGQVVGQGATVAHTRERVAPGVLEQLLVTTRQLLLAVGEADQGGALPLQHFPEATLEQQPPDRQRAAGQQHAGT